MIHLTTIYGDPFHVDTELILKLEEDEQDETCLLTFANSECWVRESRREILELCKREFLS